MEALVVLLVLVLLAGPVLAVIALVKAAGLQAVVRDLRQHIAALDAQINLKQPLPQSMASAQVAPLDVPPLESAMGDAEPVNVVEAVSEEVPELLTTAGEQVVKPVAPRDVEQALASRWLVWLGGAAIGLGGLLLIKYAHDNGLVPPIIRVCIGLAFGAGLVGAGEWLRRKRGDEASDYVPAALSAAGLVIAFGVSYAAYALYDIVAPAVAFPMLAAISLGALWLATRQGPLIAALGLVGATFSPALVPSDNPSTSGFFAYLLVIVVASLWLLRNLSWWWLGYAALASASGWALIWISSYGVTPSLPIGLFGLAVGAAAAWVPRGKGILAAEMGNLSDTKSVQPAMWIAIVGCVAGGIILSALTVQSGHAPVPLIMFAIGMAAIVGFGWVRHGMAVAPILAAVVTFIVLMVWRDVGFHTWAFDEQGLWTTVPGLVEPPRFRNAMLVAMVAFTSVGLIGTLRKSDKRVWSALAAGAAFMFMLGAWARADFALTWQMWTAVAGAAMCAFVLAVRKIVPGVDEQKTARSIEMLVGGVALLAWFALDRIFDGVWLTIALAALAAVIAMTTRMISLPNIALIASAVASFAALRLFVEREFWGEPEGLPLGGYWIVYGYGVPAALFWQASKWLRGESFTRWRIAFEGISLGLAVALVSLVLRVWIGGGIVKDEMGLLELAAHGCAWLGASYGLAYRQHLYSTFVSLWGARVLLAASCLAFLAALTIRNPVLSGDAVAGGQLINALWLAYLVPVPLLAMIARKLGGMGWAQFRDALGVFALVLLMAFVTLLVKRQFQDATLEMWLVSQAESYAVSLAWLLCGIAIFIAGLKLRRQNIRYGGLAVIVLTVLKVFGYDLFSLGGLWRIASVIGLGLCLVAVGWLYTKYVGGAVNKKPDLAA